MLFEEFPPALQAAVTAYDEARRASHGPNAPAMSDTNKATIALFIAAAIRAYRETSCDPHTAIGADLDGLGLAFGVLPRALGEPDATFRARILARIG